jgi:hypothetical protein
LGIAAAVIGVATTAAMPAQAATWTERTESGTDQHGTWATAGLSTNWQYGHASYYIHFDPYGEMLTLSDRMRDGHAARGEVLVYDLNGRLVDEDTFYAGVDESPRTINLGTPDGSGNIEENYKVWIRVCINETSTCTSYVRGIA